MSIKGLQLCARYAHPPNSLHLCGPEKQSDLAWYATNNVSDKGTQEILEQFTTLYPYLALIAAENNIGDPFDTRVVASYWIGNALLQNITISKLSIHLSDTLGLKKKLTKKQLSLLFDKLPLGFIPHHAFHVLNIWRRTGNVEDYHTLQTMEACLILFGVIKHILPTHLIVATKPLRFKNDKLLFGTPILRHILYQKEDVIAKQLRIGDTISYHWGKFAQKLTNQQKQYLTYFTTQALSFANIPSYEKNYYLYRR